MTPHYPRLLTYVAMVGLMLAVAVPAQAAPRHGAEGTSARPATHTSVAVAGIDTRWKCARVRGSMVKRQCVQFLRARKHFYAEHTRAKVNDAPETNFFKCVISQTTTIGGSVTASVEAEAGVIFAKAKTSVSATISGSMTTERMDEAQVEVPPWSVRYCQTGTFLYTTRGRVKSYIKEPGMAGGWSRGRFRAKLPTVPADRITTPRRL